MTGALRLRALPRGARSRSRGRPAWPWGRSRGAPPSRCAPRADLRHGAAGVTLNDVCLAAVTGALRETALARGESPRALKAMVPVSVRAEEAGVHRPARAPQHARLAPGGGPPRDIGVQALRAARGSGDHLRRPGNAVRPAAHGVARMVGSKRVYNLTVSNIPGPRFPLYVLGSELLEAYPVALRALRGPGCAARRARPARRAQRGDAGACPNRFRNFAWRRRKNQWKTGRISAGGRPSRGSKRTESVTTQAPMWS